MRGGVKWYLRCTVKTFLLVALWSAIMWLFTGERWVFVKELGREGWEVIYYMILGYIIFSFSGALSLYKKDIPLAISMGASRKNAFWGTCFFMGMNFVAVMILTVAVSLLTGEREHVGIWIFWGMICIVWASILGTFLGVLYQLFGKTVAIISGAVIYILLMAGLVFAGLHTTREMAAGIVRNERLFAAIAAVTALVWCGVLVLHYRTLRKITV